MSAECCGARPVRRSPRRWLAWGVAYTPAAALAVLLPKCPLCVAAQIALLGATFSGSARDIAIATALALGTAAVLLARRRVR